jgi:hypothetical protein
MWGPIISTLIFHDTLHNAKQKPQISPMFTASLIETNNPLIKSSKAQENPSNKYH